MTTLLELSRRLWRESGRIGTKPDANVAAAVGDVLRVVNAIQDEWRDLQMQPRNWKWMRATRTNALTEDDGSYAYTDLGITADTWQSWVRESDHYQPFCWVTATPGATWSLEYLPLEQFKHRYLRDTVSSGRPYHWSTDNDGSLLIGPSPDDTGYSISVDYWKAPTELTADGHEPDMPARFHLLLVWMALEQIGTADESPSQVARARNNARRLRSQLLDSQADNPNFNELGPLA